MLSFFFINASLRGLTLSKLNNIHFHPLEVVSRYRKPQLQVRENYSYLCSLRPNICQPSHSFRSQSQIFGRQIKQIKKTIVVISGLLTLSPPVPLYSFFHIFISTLHIRF